MATLEEAGTDALEKIKNLLPEFENAQKAFDETEAEIDETKASLQAQWDNVEEAAQTFLEQAKKDRTDNQQETQETVQILIGLRQAIEQMEKDAKERFDDAEEELEQFTEKVRGTIPEMEAAFEEVKATAKALQERAEAIEQALAKAVDEASDFLTTEISDEFRSLQEAVEQKADDVETYIKEEALPKVEEEAENFAAKLKEFHEGLREVVERASSKAESSFSEALENCLKEHFEVVDKIEETATSARAVLDSAMELINTGAEAVGEGKEVVDEGVNTTATGLNLVVETLTELKELFSKFSFVSM